MTGYLRTTNAGSGNGYLRTTVGPTDSTAPSLTAGPTASNITTSSFDITTTFNESVIHSLVVTAPGASQPAQEEFDSSPFRSGYVTASTPRAINYTGVDYSTTYKAWVQAKDSEGNRTTSSVVVTTLPATPNITSLSSNNPVFGSTLTITGTGFATSGNIVTLDGITQTITSESRTSIDITVNGRFGSVLTLSVREPVSSLTGTFLVTSVALPSGWGYVNVGTPNTTSSSRLTSTPDLASGDQISWGNLSGTGVITVASDATFSSSTATVSAFDFRVWTPSFGYGAVATQVIDIVAPSGYSVSIDQSSIIAANQAAISFTFSAAEVGAVYNYSFSSSAGGSIVSGTGTVTSASQVVSGINLNTVSDGTVTLSVTLTDSSGNTGTAATSIRTKSTLQTPDAFSFTPQTNVYPLGSVCTSNSITVSGMSSSATISVTGGEYSINGGTWTTINGAVSNGDTVRVRNIASSSFSTSVNTTLTIGSVSATFTSTTTAIDTTPDSFSFTPVTSASVSTVYTSNAITVSGINSSATVTITGGLYSIDGAAFTSAAGSVVTGNTLVVRGTSSSSNSTTTNIVLTVGGVSATFAITTVAPTTVTTQVTLFDIVNNANTLSINTSYDWFLMMTWGGSVVTSGTTSTTSAGVLTISLTPGTPGSSAWLGVKKSTDTRYATIIPVTLN